MMDLEITIKFAEIRFPNDRDCLTKHEIYSALNNRENKRQI
jgi:hypothetical protein